MKFILKFLPVFLATILPLASCTEDPEDAMGTIVGFVTQAPAGTEPISGVTVSILSTGQSTTTGSNGAFTFINMQPGSYSLQFSKAGYNTNSRTVTVVAGNENQCDVQMSKVNEEAEIVINPSSLNFGTTQTDMSVTIKNNGNATASWSLELGNNSWLSASQVGGSIQAGRTQSITFSVDRNYLSETRTVVVNLQAFGNSYPITVSCSPRNTTSHMVIEPTSLNFGSESTHQTFTIRNTGTSTLSWNASALTANGLSLSAMQGTVSAGGSSVVVATVDRTVITGELVTTFIISDGVKDQTVTVNINKGAGTDPDDPENPVGGTVVKNGLFVYFPFNGSFDDISGNDIFGYGSPDPTFSDDGVAAGTKAASFSRIDKSSFIVGDGLIDTRSMSICFWAKGISEGNIFYVTSSNKNDGGEEMMSFTYRDGHLKYVISRYSNHYTFGSTGNFSHVKVDDDKWHHIALVSDFNKTSYANATTLLYVDGRLMDTVTEGINPFSEAESVNAHYGTGTKFILGGKNVPNMQIANLRVYDARLLSASEIKEIYDAKQ